MNKEINELDNNLLHYPECVSLSEKGTCLQLDVEHCLGNKCSFRRTYEEDCKHKKHWSNQLLSLDEEFQIKISKKYYGGCMPWKFKH